MAVNKHDVNTLGKLAMELIADYPLYAHTSGITYEEAILVASIFYPEPKEWKQILADM